MVYEEPIDGDGDELVGVRFFCAEFNLRRISGGFRSHGLFEGF
jgi:hypothetical protein